MACCVICAFLDDGDLHANPQSSIISHMRMHPSCMMRRPALPILQRPARPPVDPCHQIRMVFCTSANQVRRAATMRGEALHLTDVIRRFFKDNTAEQLCARRRSNTMQSILLHFVPQIIRATPQCGHCYGRRCHMSIASAVNVPGSRIPLE